MDSPQIALEVAAALDEQQHWKNSVEQPSSTCQKIRNAIQPFKIDEALLATLAKLSRALSTVCQSNLTLGMSCGRNLVKV